MRYFAGLDVSLHSTSICVMDAEGRIIREAAVATEPKALVAFLKAGRTRYKRIGLEAQGTSSWLYTELARAGLPAVCIEARHASRVLKARINKTDKNDAQGIADLMRTGIFRPVHVKTLESQQIRAVLTARRLLLTKAIDVELAITGLLRTSGQKAKTGLLQKL